MFLGIQDPRIPVFSASAMSYKKLGNNHLRGGGGISRWLMLKQESE
jgi:hypothetical protein